MSKKTIYLLVCLALVSCEEMFVRQVDFKRDGEPEKMVLSGTFTVGQTPRVKVSHSYYFDRKDKSEKDSRVTDAELSMRINGQAYALSYTGDGVYKSASYPVLQAHDTVEVFATHAAYPAASTRIILPGQVKSALTQYALQPNYWLTFTLDLDAYSGNADDWIGIAAAGRLTGVRYDTRQQIYVTDTVRFDRLYSTDMVFSLAANPEVVGYYGTDSQHFLYFPSSALSEPRKIALFVDTYRAQDIQNRYSDIHVLDLTVHVISCTNGMYQFVQSTTNSYYAKYMYPPSGVPSPQENIMEEVMDAIQEALGEQEPLPVYSNVEGGLGHLAGMSNSYHVVVGDN